LKRVRWEGPALPPGKHVLEFDFNRPKLSPEEIKKLEAARQSQKATQ